MQTACDSIGLRREWLEVRVTVSLSSFGPGIIATHRQDGASALVSELLFLNRFCRWNAKHLRSRERGSRAIWRSARVWVPQVNVVSMSRVESSILSMLVRFFSAAWCCLKHISSSFSGQSLNPPVRQKRDSQCKEWPGTSDGSANSR